MAVKSKYESIIKEFEKEVQKKLENKVVVNTSGGLTLIKNNKCILETSDMFTDALYSANVYSYDGEGKKDYQISTVITLPKDDPKRICPSYIIVNINDKTRKSRTIRIVQVGNLIQVIPDWIGYQKYELDARWVDADRILVIIKEFIEKLNDGIKENYSYTLNTVKESINEVLNYWNGYNVEAAIEERIASEPKGRKGVTYKDSLNCDIAFLQSIKGDIGMKKYIDENIKKMGYRVEMDKNKTVYALKPRKELRQAGNYHVDDEKGVVIGFNLWEDSNDDVVIRTQELDLDSRILCYVNSDGSVVFELRRCIPKTALIRLVAEITLTDLCETLWYDIYRIEVLGGDRTFKIEQGYDKTTYSTDKKTTTVRVDKCTPEYNVGLITKCLKQYCEDVSESDIKEFMRVVSPGIELFISDRIKDWKQKLNKLINVNDDITLPEGIIIRGELPNVNGNIEEYIRIRDEVLEPKQK